MLMRIKGTKRREIARRALEGEELPRLGEAELYRQGMDFVLQEQLSEEQRDRWGKMDPTMMGGEYLPDLEEGEVAIARLELGSVTTDVIEVRARLVLDGASDGVEAESASGFCIHYRIVDEYSAEGSRRESSPSVTSQPLSFGELIDVIDEIEDDGIPGSDESYDDWLRNGNYTPGDDPADLLHFVSVTSIFYPPLGAYYADRAEAWRREMETRAF